MIDSDRKRAGWPIGLKIAVVVWALLACGFVIHLARQKVAVEEKIEQKFSTGEKMPRPTPYFRPLDESDN